MIFNPIHSLIKSFRKAGRMIIRNWLDCPSTVTHGAMIERTIFTKATLENLNKPGAILTYAKSFSRAYLEAGVATTPIAHEDEQEVLYITRGRGVIKLGEGKEEVGEGSIILVPPGLTHSLVNEAKEPMELLRLVEEAPKALKTEGMKAVVRSYHNLPIYVGHWCHLVRRLLSREDGLIAIHSILIVEIEGMQIPEPHPHPPGTEEVWYLVRGRGIHWVGQEIRRQREGDAVACIPPEALHSLINHTRKPLQAFHFAHYGGRP